jgi:hypothetical protein
LKQQTNWISRRAPIGIVLIGVLVALLVSPGAAGAKGGGFALGPSHSVELRLKGSKGYSISVSGDSKTVTLTAERKGSSASYTTKGFASDTRIKARLGRLGRVSVRFHPRGRPKHVPFPQGNCRGGTETVDSGTWVGRIDFEGELGYTVAHATRARGKITSSTKLTCSGHEEKGGNHPDFQSTMLSASSDARAIFSTAFLFTSETLRGLDGAAFDALLLEAHNRGLTIVRSINAEAKSNAVVLNKEGGHIASATIAPPAPFMGTATFQSTRGSKGSWTGTLAGDFPGRGVVTLAGPEFSAKVLRVNG